MCKLTEEQVTLLTKIKNEFVVIDAIEDIELRNWVQTLIKQRKIIVSSHAKKFLEIDDINYNQLLGLSSTGQTLQLNITVTRLRSSIYSYAVKYYHQSKTYTIRLEFDHEQSEKNLENYITNHIVSHITGVSFNFVFKLEFKLMTRKVQIRKLKQYGLYSIMYSLHGQEYTKRINFKCEPKLEELENYVLKHLPNNYKGMPINFTYKGFNDERIAITEKDNQRFTAA